MPKEIKQENEWIQLKNKKRKVILPEPTKEVSDNLRQIEIPYTRSYRPRLTKRTGRVVQFATRVTPEFDKWVRGIVQKENIYLAEVLERMMTIYQKEVHKYNFQYKDNNHIRERESKNPRNSRKNKKTVAK